MGSPASRVLLLLLALAAVGAGGLYLAFGIRTEPGGSGVSESSSDSSEAPARAALEPSGDVATARSGAADAARAQAPAAGPTKTLVITGTVVDLRGGDPVSDVEVRVSAGPVPDGAKKASSKTDDQGRYAVELAIPADVKWNSDPWAVHLVAQGDRIDGVGDRLVESDFRADPQDPSRFLASRDLRVTVLLAVRGKLVREWNGEPVAGGSANLIAVEPPPKNPRPIADATTDESGNFLIRVAAAEPGDLAILATASGFLGRIVPVVLDPSRVVDAGLIALGEGACIEGVVTTADGSRPIAKEVHASLKTREDAWFFVGNDMWGHRGTTVARLSARAPIGPDGRFRICGLPAEEHELTLLYSGCGHGGRRDSIDVRAPKAGVRLEVFQCVYRLRAIDAATGAAVANARFHFDEASNFICPLDEGNVILADPGGEHPGKVLAEGYRTAPVTLPPLAAAEVRDLEVRLEKLAKPVVATLVVLSPHGDAVEEVEAEIRSADGGADDQGPMTKLVHAAEDGRHALPPLAAGPYRILIEPLRGIDVPGTTWLAATIDLDVREGMEPVEVRLEEGGLVTARVTKGGESVDAHTWLLREPASEAEQVVWHDGVLLYGGWVPKGKDSVLYRPLPEGSWTFRFAADGCESRDVVVRVMAGETSKVDVALEPREPR